MTDLEGRIRELLEDDARSAPSPHEPERVLGRTRRREARTIVGGALVAVVAIAGAVVGLRAMLASDRVTVADVPLGVTTINGVSITHPEGWFVFDPSQLLVDLTADDDFIQVQPTPGLPRAIAVSPTAPDEEFGCPGMVEGAGPAFFMIVTEQPSALAGPSAAPWPVALEPLAIESAGGDPVEAGNSTCYPDWELLGAGWTASGRTFEAVVRFAPDATDEDRKAVGMAFESMTFEPAADGPSAVVIATGTAGGEAWELTAERQGEELVLSVQAGSTGGGSRGFDPDSPQLSLMHLVFGEGADQQRLVFGAVPVDAVRIELSSDQQIPAGTPPVIDIPDEIDPTMNAFAFAVDPHAFVSVSAFDDLGLLMASGAVGPDAAQGSPGLEDGRHFGFVRSVDVQGGVITFDVATWLSGVEAEAAAAERGDVVTDGYYIVNDDATPSTVPIAPDVEVALVDWLDCCNDSLEGDISMLARAIAEQRDITVGDVLYLPNSSWWITVRDGVVVRIEEQYRP